MSKFKETHTIMTAFKRELLYFCKNIGFTTEEKENNTIVENIDDYITLLLNDKKMMEADNPYSFEERTRMTQVLLLQNIALILVDNDSSAEYQMIKVKAKTLIFLFDGLNICHIEPIKN